MLGERRPSPSLASSHSLDRLPASSRRAVLRGKTCRLSPQAPLSLWSGLTPARPVGPIGGRCRDFPKQDGEEDHLALRPSCFGHPLQVILFSCGALAVSSFACRRCPLPPVTNIPVAHDDGSLQHLSSIGLDVVLFLRRGSQACARDRCCFV
ncbi:hypothetical protein RHEC894_PC00105 (plasmid) [Rhizobium sp. CIAT894]|nr:hypothetical protein RHEC894_PC00105 [Rhizobium sp. CIAT894]